MINPDCQMTHYAQEEIEKLEQRASESSRWEELFHNAANANAKLEKDIERCLIFVRQMAHHGKCKNNSNLVCLSCLASSLLEELYSPLEWAEFQASIKL